MANFGVVPAGFLPPAGAANLAQLAAPAAMVNPIGGPGGQHEQQTPRIKKHNQDRNKPYKCGMCDKTFARRGDCINHELLKHQHIKDISDNVPTDDGEIGILRNVPIDMGISDGEQEHVDECLFMSIRNTQAIPKTECDEPAHHQQNGFVGVGSGTNLITLSKDRCAECYGILPDIPASRLHHTNVKHLKLSLYKCPLCSKEFSYVIYGLGHCKHHIRYNHPGVPMPSDDEFTLSNMSEKMIKIRSKVAELFVVRLY
uniref:C2H2-type domain-containing protein n=1 Tax=Globodera pallida TaxID=36090 RepID=A0A183CI19_GLOPA